METVPAFFGSADAECRKLGIDGLRIMNPEDRDVVAENAARSICADCVFIEPCKNYGIKHAETGVYGGLTERERKNVRNKIRNEHKRGRARKA